METAPDSQAATSLSAKITTKPPVSGFIKFIRIFLLILIVIGIGLLCTIHFWVPKLVAEVIPSQRAIVVSPSISTATSTSIQNLSTQAVNFDENHPLSFIIQSSTGIPEEIDISPCPTDLNVPPYFCFGSGEDTHPTLIGKSVTLYEGLVDREGGASYGVVVNRPDGTVSAYSVNMNLTQKYTETQYQNAYEEFRILLITYLNLPQS